MPNPIVSTARRTTHPQMFRSKKGNAFPQASRPSAGRGPDWVARGPRASGRRAAGRGRGRGTGGGPEGRRRGGTLRCPRRGARTAGKDAAEGPPQKRVRVVWHFSFGSWIVIPRLPPRQASGKHSGSSGGGERRGNHRRLPSSVCKTGAWGSGGVHRTLAGRPVGGGRVAPGHPEKGRGQGVFFLA